jgi:uroporphyrinogen-III decarboxylase
LGEAEFLEFAMPCFQKLYTKDLEVRFLHNDAPCKVSAPFLTQMGVNLYNPGIDVSLSELRALAGPELTILGNLPPRDVLAAGTPESVEQETRAMVASIPNRARIIFSAGGGMPPGVSTANINAFIKAVRATA